VLDRCKAVAVLIGPQGLGRWQQREAQLALDRQAREQGFPVVPILLPGGDPALGFLALNTWIDLRQGTKDEDWRCSDWRSAASRPGRTTDRIRATRAAICPYRGLRPFREEDAAFFCGREAFTESLLETVNRQSFVAVVGASGCGKSSVVRAGLTETPPAEGRRRARLGHRDDGAGRAAAGEPGGGADAVAEAGPRHHRPPQRGQQAGRLLERRDDTRGRDGHRSVAAAIRY
jgi:hypothetical protein